MEQMQVADDLISLGSSRPLIRFLFCIACLFSSEASGWFPLRSTMHELIYGYFRDP